MPTPNYLRCIHPLGLDIRIDAAQKLATLDVAAIKRADVQPVAEGIMAWGLRVSTIHIAPSAQGVVRFRFAHSGPVRREALHRFERLLLTTGCLLCAAPTGSSPSTMAVSWKTVPTPNCCDAMVATRCCTGCNRGTNMLTPSPQRTPVVPLRRVRAPRRR